MVTTHRISADLYFEDFELIAVHADVHDFSLAYHLNKTMGLQLARRKKDLCLQDDIWFATFEWSDDVNDNYWMLVANHCKTETNNSSIGLFGQETATVSRHLVEERKEVDYFLKLETEIPGMVDKTLKSLKEIPGVLTAYGIDTEILKSKKNLIL